MDELDHLMGYISQIGPYNQQGQVYLSEREFSGSYLNAIVHMLNAIKNTIPAPTFYCQTSVAIDTLDLLIQSIQFRIDSAPPV